MREGGVFADLAACVAGDSAAGVGCVDELGELAVGHAGLCGFVGGFVDGEGDVVGELHEGQLGGGFDAAAAEGDGRCAGGGEAGLAWAMPSAKTNWVRSSTPILPRRYRCGRW